MHVLIVYAHPEPTSFNAALRDAARDEAEALGHTVDVSDLYADGFCAVGGRGDFVTPQDPAVFHYQAEQRAAALNHGFVPDVAREQSKLRGADCLILQFPIWWGGPPAILKGWIDRVCAYGVTYADGVRFETGLFTGRRSLISTTTGGTAHRFSSDGTYGPIDKALWPIQQLFLGYLGFDLVEPHVCYGVPRAGEAERVGALQDLRDRIRALLSEDFEAVPIPDSQSLLKSVGTRNWSSKV